MSDYEILKKKYEALIKDTQELAQYKLKIAELEETNERLNRLVNYKEKEIIELYLLLGKKVEFKINYERTRN